MMTRMGRGGGGRTKRDRVAAAGVAGVAQIALTATRFTGSGVTTISSALPLASGTVAASGVSGWGLYDSTGTEVSAYLEPLGLNYPDGSVRSLLIQHTKTITGSESFTLRPGTSVSRASKVTPSAFPAAMFLHADEDARVGCTGLYGTLVKDGSLSLGAGSVANLRAEYSEDYDNAELPTTDPRDSSADYEFAAVSMEYYAMSGDTAKLRTGLGYVYDYCDGRSPVPSGFPAAQSRIPWSYLHGYMMTGASLYLDWIRWAAWSGCFEARPGGDIDGWGTTGWSEERIRSRNFRAVLAAKLAGLSSLSIDDLNGSTNAVYDVDTHLVAGRQGFLDAIAANGRIGPTTDDCKPFMSSDLLLTMILDAELLDATGQRAAILTAAQDHFNALWAADWDAVLQRFPYTTVSPSPYWIDDAVDYADQVLPLSGMHLAVVTWIARETGNATWRDRSEALAAPLYAYLNGLASYFRGKDFDEAFYFAPRTWSDYSRYMEAP